MDDQFGGNVGILARLRLETRAEHERLEKDLAILRADLSLHGYRSLVKKFYGFYAAYEHQLTRVNDEELQNFLATRWKVPLLRQDLHMLGIEPDELSLLEQLPALATLAETLGSLYVTEGSTLGGQILVRHVRAVLNLSSDGPCKFLLGYGAGTGTMWRGTQTWLERRTAGHSADMVVAGARQTFNVMHEWMCERSS